MSSLVSLMNLVGTLLFFEEPAGGETGAEAPRTFERVFRDMVLVFGNFRFISFLVIFSGFWIMFWQIFYSLPFYVKDVLRFPRFELIETVDAWSIAMPVFLPRPELLSVCEKKKQLVWAEWLQKEVLEPVPDRHVVLTMPRLLSGIFREHRELLLDLAQCAADAVAEYMTRQVGAEARPGIVVSIASAGDLLQWHPHGHFLVTDGAFSDDGAFHPLETWGDANKRPIGWPPTGGPAAFSKAGTRCGSSRESWEDT